MAKEWTLGRIAMSGSLLCAHLWGTMLIVAVMQGRDSAVIGDMFSAVGFMIFSTLGVLVGGKGWKDFTNLRWGSNVTTVNKQVETTITGPSVKPTVDSDEPII